MKYSQKVIFEQLERMSQEELADLLDVSQSYISSLSNGKRRISKKMALLFHEKLGADKDRLLSEHNQNIYQPKAPPDKKYNNQETLPIEPKDDLEPQPLKGLTKIHIVQNTNAMAGWLDNYYADEYLEQLPTIETPTEKNHSGLYLAFKVINDSMEPDYIEGDTVIGREVSRVYWKDKLHINKWDFIIAHNTKGVLIKEITEHNPETGQITLHSLNPNYEDQVVNLKEVSRIFNVVDHRPDIVKRRLRRK